MSRAIITLLAIIGALMLLAAAGAVTVVGRVGGALVTEDREQVAHVGKEMRTGPDGAPAALDRLAWDDLYKAAERNDNFRMGELQRIGRVVFLPENIGLLILAWSPVKSGAPVEARVLDGEYVDKRVWTLAALLR